MEVKQKNRREKERERERAQCGSIFFCVKESSVVQIYRKFFFLKFRPFGVDHVNWDGSLSITIITSGVSAVLAKTHIRFFGVGLLSSLYSGFELDLAGLVTFTCSWLNLRNSVDLGSFGRTPGEDLNEDRHISTGRSTLRIPPELSKTIGAAPMPPIPPPISEKSNGATSPEIVFFFSSLRMRENLIPHTLDPKLLRPGDFWEVPIVDLHDLHMVHGHGVPAALGWLRVAKVGNPMAAPHHGPITGAVVDHSETTGGSQFGRTVLTADEE